MSVTATAWSVIAIMCVLTGDMHATDYAAMSKAPPCSPAMTENIKLALLIEDDMLRIEVANNSHLPQRFWQQDNSWGWEMPRIQVMQLSRVDSESTGSTSTESAVQLRPALRLWTRNFPAFIELRRGESTSYSLGATDFLADDLNQALALADQPLMVSAALIGTASTEQETHAVWCGALSSEPVRSEPPHRWLGQTANAPLSADNEDLS